MPLHHFSVIIPLNKLEDMVTWLTAANAPMGFKELMRPVPHVVGMGESRPYLWVIGDENIKVTPEVEQLWKCQHIAFAAQDIQQVQQWHAAAIRAGGTDNGAPGPRPENHPTYYGAFARDPVCGINFEAVSYTTSSN